MRPVTSGPRRRPTGRSSPWIPISNAAPSLIVDPEGQPFIKDFKKNVKLVAFGARIEKDGNARLLTRAFFTDSSPYAKHTGKAEPLRTTLFSSLSDELYLGAALARISPELNFESLIAAHHHHKLSEDLRHLGPALPDRRTPRLSLRGRLQVGMSLPSALRAAPVTTLSWFRKM
jgi:hypothetical protein